MPYVTPAQVQAAKQIDLLTYLQRNDPDQLVRLSADTYCTREHDSLKISNGKWHWFSRGIGGKTALDYLIKVQNYPFPQAVSTVLGQTAEMPPVFCVPKPKPPKKLMLPEANENADQVVHYLKSRGIDSEIIQHCLDHGLLYESLPYHNAVFVGYDLSGKPRYASLRGTGGGFKGEVSGSDKHYSFSLPGRAESRAVHVFEAAIDALSYATLLKMTGRDWRQDTLLSLAGVHKAKFDGYVPQALDRYLQDHPASETLLLHLDNDEVGRAATQAILNSLGKWYRVVDSPPPSGKDVNDYLLERIEKRHQPNEKSQNR